MPGIPITNDIELLKIVGGDFEKVIDEVSDWLVTRIQDAIMDKVYNVPQMANSPYERLMWKGGFIGAWGKETTQFIGNYITNTIGMLSVDHPMIHATPITYNAEKLQHGNTDVDRTDYMDQYIAEGSNYDIGGNASMERDYWSEIVQVVESGELDSILEKAMSARGIMWQRI